MIISRTRPFFKEQDVRYMFFFPTRKLFTVIAMFECDIYYSLTVD